jgi:phage baseplate assembly protein W
MTIRSDCDLPFHIDPSSARAAQCSYPSHVDQLIRQVLLTSPGERVCLPDFGCGLRQLLFAPQSDALIATVKVEVGQALTRWVGDQVKVKQVDVRSGAGGNADAGLDEGALLITVSYTLVETMSSGQVTVVVV